MMSFVDIFDTYFLVCIKLVYLVDYSSVYVSTCNHQ